MSAINFQDRLELAFRGSAKEQKKATKEFRKRARARFKSFAGATSLDKKKLGGGSNIFKSNLGGISGRPV